MFYFGDEKCDSIIVEQTDGKIIRMRTDLPEINSKILSDLKQYLEKLNEKQNKKK